ncbi:thioredoxin domain-containing protein, partial [Streptomyces sp. NPDC002722]|uniref:thioredoxin family protein n=1 Tax=unclassified Streptomyces TaxID=2593676 RepID=UPI00332BD495
CDKNDAGWVVTDRSGRTSVAGVWAVGNVVDPRAQVVAAAGRGSSVAFAINTDLLDEDVDRAVDQHRQAAAAVWQPTTRQCPCQTAYSHSHKTGNPRMTADAPRPVDSVTEQTYTARVLQAERPVLVQFWATWCHPCRMVTPIVEQLAAEQSGHLDIVKVDLDAEPGLAAQLGITSVPAFVVYTGGRPVGSWVGAAPKHVLEKKLASILGAGSDGW